VSKLKQERQFTIVPTGGGLRVKRWLRRVHLRGVEGATLYVGERIVPLSKQKDMWKHPEKKTGFYISVMAFETERCQTATTFKKAVRKAKRRLLVFEAAVRLGGSPLSP
jgi:hypothetical protein